MSEPFKIIYNQGRFPIRQRRADGTWGCRGCGEPIPKGRRTWCSRECSERFNPQEVFIAVRKRDKDICVACGFDCDKEYRKWLTEKYRLRSVNYSEYEAWKNNRPPIAEYDHIIPFSEGGLTVLENIRTLCSDCHKLRTKLWHREKRDNPNQLALL